MPRFLVSALTFVLLCISAALHASERITIATASDLRYALTDIVAQFQQQHSDVQIDLVFGSSGKISTQIRHGAPFDVFFSADIQYPQALYAEGHAITRPAPYAVGRLVLWSPQQNMTGIALEQLPSLSFKRLAIAQPAHAPYGLRAKQALQATGQWAGLEKKLVYGENIAQTAQMAQSGGAEIAIIALSLAKFPELERHGYQLIPSHLHQPLTQAFVITKHGQHKPAARQFADFMTTPAAITIMQHYGFELPTAMPAQAGE